MRPDNGSTLPHYVNDRKVNKPRVSSKPGDSIQLREKSQKVDRYKDWFNFFEQKLAYIQRDSKKIFPGTLMEVPEREGKFPKFMLKTTL
ncbi:MAG: hypothetical protein CM1200mP28_18030 [Deltaproteobacteria bacterium]|nr:MAG: hypothetical protein CM1200mP28_18030 [Deltaproteobacteria bacterium]